MKCIILAAGYATRLYPLTNDLPKPLLPVAGKPILDRIMEDLEGFEAPMEYLVVTNHRFIKPFEAWRDSHKLASAIRLLDDGSTENDNRLGAVRDMAFAIRQAGVDEEVFVAAGDNLTDFSLTGFLTYARQKGTSCVMRYYEGEEDRLHRTGVITLGEGDLVTSMEEKPAKPKSHWCVPPFYYYQREDVKRIPEAVDTGVCGVDAPGEFLSWLCTVSPVHAWEMPGRRYDIGTLEGYRKVEEIWTASGMAGRF